MNCHKPINNPTPSLNDEFGHAVAMTPNGDLLVGVAFDDAGALNAGSAYLFDGNTGNLLLTINNPTPAEGDQFGHAVATTPNGDLLVSAFADNTGATSAGSAYLFDGNTGHLLLTINNPTPENSDFFGNSVTTTIYGELLISAVSDNTGATNAGSAYLFDGNTGNLLFTINNPTPAHNDLFGVSVATTPSGDLLVGANYDDTGATEAGSAYLFDGTIVFSQPAPTIISLGVDDPDNLDDIYSRSDTITVTFDSDTNEPGGTSVQRKPVIDDMFTFTESLGRAYSGKWIAPDTFVITVKSVNNAGPPIISGTTVTPAGTTPILSIDETSDASSVTSPVLSGDFGITP